MAQRFWEVFSESFRSLFRGRVPLAASQEIARSFSVGVGQKLMEGVGLKPDDAMNAAYPVHLGVRITGDPANGYTSFMLAGLMLNGLQIGVMVTLAPLLVTEILGLRRGREYPSWLLALAGALPYPMVAFVGFVVSMLVCVHVFAVPMRGSWLDACLLGMLSYGLVVAVVTQAGHAARQPVLPADAFLEHGARALPHRLVAALLGQHRKAHSARRRLFPHRWRALSPPAAAEPQGSRWIKSFLNHRREAGFRLLRGAFYCLKNANENR